MRPGIVFRLLFDFLGVGLFKQSRELRTQLREMIKKLCVGKVV
jgi:hypothetical protein